MRENRHPGSELPTTLRRRASREIINAAIKRDFLLSFLESVPEVSARLKAPITADRKFEDVVKSAQDAAVLVLVYWSATGAVLRFGDSAERFGEWQHRFGHAIMGLAQSLLGVRLNARQPESLCTSGVNFSI